MAIKVLEVLSGSSGKWKVKAQHGDNTIVAELAIDRAMPGREHIVEIGIERVENWFKSDLPSEIVTLPSGLNRMTGQIHSHMDLEDGTVLYDLYVASGAEYFAIDSTDIGGAVLQDGDRVAIEVAGLCFYPTGI